MVATNRIVPSLAVRPATRSRHINRQPRSPHARAGRRRTKGYPMPPAASTSDAIGGASTFCWRRGRNGLLPSRHSGPPVRRPTFRVPGGPKGRAVVGRG
jgi:hypothetical protein